MYIVEIIPEFAIGGAEKLLIDLSNEFIKEHTVTICLFKTPEQDNFFLRQANKNIKVVSLQKEKGKIKFFLNLFKFIYKEKPDIIHSHLTPVIIYLFFISPFFPKARFFHTIHNSYSIPKKNLVTYIRKRFLRSKRVTVVTISNTIDQSFRQVFGNQKTAIIDNGVKQPIFSESLGLVEDEINKIKKDDNTKVLISVQRIVPFKNLELIIDVFRNAYEINLNIVLLLIGGAVDSNIPYLNKLKKMSPPNVFFIGEKSNVPDYLKHADAFCISSKSFEGLPISMIEALSIGVPVITTLAGGIPDVIEDKVNGFHVEKPETEIYLEVIKEFIVLPQDFINEIKRNNVNLYSKKYSIEIAASRYLSLFKI